jgi:hypothetical protein
MLAGDSGEAMQSNELQELRPYESPEVAILGNSEKVHRLWRWRRGEALAGLI